MTSIYVGDRVVIDAHWSSFHMMRGVVTSVAPLMVRLDGDERPVLFFDGEARRIAVDT